MSNPIISARIGVLESRIEALDEEVETLAALRESKLKERHAAVDELDRLRDKERGKLRPEEVRDAIVKLGTFTKNELATELGVPAAKLTKPMAAWEQQGLLRELAFRAFGKKTYEYVVPADAGPEFLAQQRLRIVEPSPEEHAAATAIMPDRGGAVEGAGRKQGAEAITAKEVRQAVRYAQERGWELSERAGHGHYKMTKVIDGVTHQVPVPVSAGKPVAAARRIRGAVDRLERGVA